MKVSKDGVSFGPAQKALTKVAIRREIVEDYGPMHEAQPGRAFGKKYSVGQSKAFGPKRQSITNSTATNKDQIVGGAGVASSQRSSSYNQYVPNST